LKRDLRSVKKSVCSNMVIGTKVDGATRGKGALARRYDGHNGVLADATYDSETLGTLSKGKSLWQCIVNADPILCKQRCKHCKQPLSPT